MIELNPRVDLGDVGYITRGTFRLLFNIHRDAGDERQIHGVPPAFVKLELHETGIDRQREWLREPAYLNTHRGISTGFETSVSAPGVGGGSLAYDYVHKQGATLAYHDLHELRVADNTAHYERYFRDHYRSWLEFLRQHHYDRDIRLEDLILVTGCERTRAWATAWSKTTSQTARASLKVEPIAVPGLSVTLTGSVQWHEVVDVISKSGPPPEELQCSRTISEPTPKPDDFKLFRFLAATLAILFSYLGLPVLSSCLGLTSILGSANGFAHTIGPAHSPGIEANSSDTHVPNSAVAITNGPTTPSLPSQNIFANQCIFVRGLRGRLAVSRRLKLKAAAGPHVLPSPDRDDEDGPAVRTDTGTSDGSESSDGLDELLDVPARPTSEDTSLLAYALKIIVEHYDPDDPDELLLMHDDELKPLLPNSKEHPAWENATDIRLYLKARLQPSPPPASPHETASSSLSQIATVTGSELQWLRSTLQSLKLSTTFFIVTQYSKEDMPYDWLMFWLARHPEWQRSRQFENPADTTHTIFYRGHWLYVSHERKSNGYELLSISVVAKDDSLLKQFVLQAKREYEDEAGNRIQIYFADTYGSWRWADNERKRPMSSIVLNAGVKEMLLADTKDFLRSEKWYADRGLPFKRGYLLYGVSGSGKSSLIHAIAGELGLDIYVVSINSPWINEGILATLMGRVPSRCIVLFEDFDAACAHSIDDTKKAQEVVKGERAGIDEDNEEATTTTSHHRPRRGEIKSTDPIADSNALTTSGLLAALDALTESEGRLIFATTQHLEKLDPDLCRPGRMDVWIEFKNASKWQAKCLFQNFFPVTDGEGEVEKVSVMMPSRPSDSKSGGAHSMLDTAFSEATTSVSFATTPSTPMPSTSPRRSPTQTPKKSLNGKRRVATVEEMQEYIVACAMARNPLTAAQLERLACQFAENIPNDEFSIAELQEYLLKNKDGPGAAVHGAAAWVSVERDLRKKTREEREEHRVHMERDKDLESAQLKAVTEAAAAAVKDASSFVSASPIADLPAYIEAAKASATWVQMSQFKPIKTTRAADLTG
ncbi:unnamed protein product [Peniophora sp. CBMAI 1063]|nr:unnamed protein product [Peniophora sp. CBMAI 1063]